MNRRIILTLIIALFSFQGMAQKLPNWVTNKPTPSNSTYEYVVEWATGATELEARNQAIARVFQSTAMLIGQPYDSEEINRAVQRGTDYSVISATFNIPIKKVCEYADKKQSICRVYVLCQVAKAGNIRPIFDDFNACYEGNDKYYASDALYADGFTISQNGRKLSDSEIRTLFANSKSYELYDRGIELYERGENLENEDYHPMKGFVYLIEALSLGAGLGMQVCWVWAEEDADYKTYAQTGLWLMGGGMAVILANVILENGMKASGKAKIRKAVNLYNNGKMYSQSEWEMEYGLNGNGVFLSFSF